MTKYQSKMEEGSRCKKGLRIFQNGDSVWMKNFGKGEKWLPGIIQKKLGAVNYEVLVEGFKQPAHRHIDQLLDRVSIQCSNNTEVFDIGNEINAEVESNYGICENSESGRQVEVAVEGHSSDNMENGMSGKEDNGNVHGIKDKEVTKEVRVEKKEELRHSERKGKVPKWMSSNEYVMT